MKHLILCIGCVTLYLSAPALSQPVFQDDEWVSLSSSLLVAACYESEARTLSLWLKPGGIYEFYDVPPSFAKDLVAAPSPGRYFNTHLRNLYAYQRIAFQKPRLNPNSQ